jgi:hypothetical protein
MAVSVSIATFAPVLVGVGAIQERNRNHHDERDVLDPCDRILFRT